jgi:4-amino-4-deoxy-L-arabinose transferase-like glycosyltransferase
MTGISTTARLESGSRALRLYLPLVAIVLLAWALQLYGLETKSLWHDELGTLRNSGWGGSWLDAFRNPLIIPTLPKPPLSFVFTRAFLTLGDTAFALRLPSVLFATLTIPVTYALGRVLFGTRVGLLAAFLLAIAPLHVRYAQEARMYSMLAFFSILSLYLFWRAVRARSGWWWALFAVATALNLYTHQFAFLSLGVTALFGLWLLIDGRARPQFPFQTWHYFAALAGICLSYLPMVSFFLEGLTSEEGLGGGAPTAYGELNWSVASLASAFRLFGGANDVGLALYGGLCALALAMLAIHQRTLLRSRAANPQRDRGLPIRTNRALVLLVLWMVLPLVIVLSIPTGHGVRIRYLLFLLPVYLLLVAYALDLIILWTSSWLSDLRSSTNSPTSIQMPLTITALGILFVISLPSLASYYAETKQNWRDATWMVQTSALPGDILFVSRGHHRTGVLFYAQQWAGGTNSLTEENIRILPKSPTEDLLPPDHDQAWLIVPLEEEYLPGGELDSMLRPHYRLLPPAVFDPSNIPQDSPLLGPVMFRSLAVLQLERLKAPSITFSADDAAISEGDCTRLRWEVENVREVYLDGAGVIGQGDLEVCPTATTNYELEAIQLDGETAVNRVNVEVTSP